MTRRAEASCEENSVDAALQGLSQEITLFFTMSSWTRSEVWTSAQRDPEKACNLFPRGERLDMATAVYLRELVSSRRCHLCSGCDKEASTN